jgi:HAD superfamily hydrolase (TIGR01509 family)
MARMSKALIFDCDGVLGDTEQFGHLPAFNQMWSELGVPWRWSIAEYGDKLKIGGGKERMASVLDDPTFRTNYRVPEDERARHDLLSSWHARKTAIYKNIISSGKIPPRSGVQRLAEEALSRGWLLAVASTSAKESVNAVLSHAMGEDMFQRFALVLAGDVVEAKKPSPDIYTLAARGLGVAPQDCIAVEDSHIGVLAATKAGMRTIVTVSSYTRYEDFSDAEIVLTCLGDPQGEHCQVLENRSHAQPGEYFTVEDLETVLG